jgi:TPR repeat protein
LGLLYQNGDGVPRDHALAAAWFRKAADQGDSAAQLNLAFSYQMGQGVPQDYAQAAAWYRKAADQGDASAESNLGLLFHTGLGVPQDDEQAAAWFRKPLNRGSSAHSSISAGSTTKGTKGVHRTPRKRLRSIRKAADQNAIAQLTLGALYDNGVASPGPRASGDLVSQGGGPGVAAMYNLGMMYSAGQGVRKTRWKGTCVSLAAARPQKQKDYVATDASQVS